MNPEVRQCQNCKNHFTIEPADFQFYEKMKVPPPTWCPECRMIRRFSFFNERKLFRRQDDATKKEIFSGFPPEYPGRVCELGYWRSDAWDPMDYGRDYDFSRPFFEQFWKLLTDVPIPNRNATNVITSEYTNNCGNLKNCYLVFDTGDAENCAYVIRGIDVKDSMDLYEAFHTDFSYGNYMSDEAYRVFYSVNCEDCIDVWFSRNLVGCSHCFGCMNLRGKSYYIFNQPHTKESYLKFMEEFQSGSYQTVSAMRERAYAFWKTQPVKFTLTINVENSTGEHIERSKNLRFGYSIHEGENLAFSQFIDPPANDSMDISDCFRGVSQVYESLASGLGVSRVKFSAWCWPSNEDVEYSMFCRSSSNLFGCVSLQQKEYCIFNKQYSPEEYFWLREKIIRHMNEMPYIDAKGRIYRYGEFFPMDFSPFAYNETMAQDFFSITKEDALQNGYPWRDSEERSFEITMKAEDLPDHIDGVSDSITNEVIGCKLCKRAYRVIQMELEFLRRAKLPLPRLCIDCRFRELCTFVNPPRWRYGKCQCAGIKDDQGIYNNVVSHFHTENHCPNEFWTSYAPGSTEIIYCEQCYQSEVV